MMSLKRVLTPARILLLATAASLLLSACALPRIIVLHDPLTPEEHDNLGRIYESQGKTELALSQYRDALRQDKKHLPSLLLLGDLSYRLEKYDEAESAYRKALDLDPKNADCMNDLAWVYLRTGKNLGKARDLITAALALNPGHRPYYLDTLGVVLLKQGDAAAAITALQESVDTLPQDQPDLLAEAKQHLEEARKAAGSDQSSASPKP